MEAALAWALAHYGEIVAGLLLADRIAAATPETFKLLRIPIGKWDNQLVDGARFVLGAIFGKTKGEKEQDQERGRPPSGPA